MICKCVELQCFIWTVQLPRFQEYKLLKKAGMLIKRLVRFCCLVRRPYLH